MCDFSNPKCVVPAAPHTTCESCGKKLCYDCAYHVDHHRPKDWTGGCTTDFYLCLECIGIGWLPPSSCRHCGIKPAQISTLRLFQGIGYCPSCLPKELP